MSKYIQQEKLIEIDILRSIIMTHINVVHLYETNLAASAISFILLCYIKEKEKWKTKVSVE